MTTGLVVLSVVCLFLYSVGAVGTITRADKWGWTKISLGAAGFVGCLCLFGFAWIMAASV